MRLFGKWRVVMLAVVMMTTARGFPIMAPGLDELFEFSPVIVLGVRGKVPTDFDATFRGASSSVVISVREVLKGKLEQTSLVLPVEVGLICPAPPRFEEGKKQIIFLAEREKRLGGGLRVNFLSHGVKTVTEAEVDSFRKALASWSALAARGKPSSAERTAWLVEQCKVPVLRPFAVERLMTLNEAATGFAMQANVTMEQRLVVSNLLVSAKELSMPEIRMMEALEWDRGGAMRMLVAQLERTHQRMAEDSEVGRKLVVHEASEDWLMWELLERFPDAKAKRIYEASGFGAPKGNVPGFIQAMEWAAMREGIVPANGVVR